MRPHQRALFIHTVAGIGVTRNPSKFRLPLGRATGNLNPGNRTLLLAPLSEHV
jgi:hypothetical protein